jgi:hypothetical protein
LGGPGQAQAALAAVLSALGSTAARNHHLAAAAVLVVDLTLALRLWVALADFCLTLAFRHQPPAARLLRQARLVCRGPLQF